MKTTKLSLRLDDKKNMHLGDVLRDALAGDETKEFSATLTICNEVLWGRFPLPLCIGFSTPLASLGTLTPNHTLDVVFGGEKNISGLFHAWRKEWSRPVYRKLECRKFTLSSDKQQCALCLQDYKVGEALIELPVCKHVFHAACQTSIQKSRDLCPLCRKEGRLPSMEGLTVRQRIDQAMREAGY